MTIAQKEKTVLGSTVLGSIERFLSDLFQKIGEVVTIFVLSLLLIGFCAAFWGALLYYVFPYDWVIRLAVVLWLVTSIWFALHVLTHETNDRDFPSVKSFNDALESFDADRNEKNDRSKENRG